MDDNMNKNKFHNVCNSVYNIVGLVIVGFGLAFALTGLIVTSYLVYTQ